MLNGGGRLRRFASERMSEEAGERESERGGWRGACVAGCCDYIAPRKPLRDTRAAEGGSA
eukprot:scaffold98814_cov73-Phaeocystis_antarctica.AAC.12